MSNADTVDEIAGQIYLCEYVTPGGLRSVTFCLTRNERTDYADGQLVIRNVMKSGKPVVRVYDHVFCFEPAGVAVQPQQAERRGSDESVPSTIPC